MRRQELVRGKNGQVGDREVVGVSRQDARGVGVKRAEILDGVFKILKPRVNGLIDDLDI